MDKTMGRAGVVAWICSIVAISSASNTTWHNTYQPTITTAPPTSLSRNTTSEAIPSAITNVNITTTASIDVCRNSIDTCSHYGLKPCTQAVYEAWAKSHCALYCGFCTPDVIISSECHDKSPNCPEYDDGQLCTGDQFYVWAYENCRAYCNLGQCNNTVCEDDPNFNCDSVEHVLQICDNINKAKQVCRKYCKLCDLVDGQWSVWSSYGACDVTCGNGTETRTRTCTNPAPAHRGANCTGQDRETVTCFTKECPVNGGWSIWGSWGSCSATCGIGMRRRDRYCDHPYPALNGDHCFGESIGYTICMEGACSDGGWSEWEEWSNCSDSQVGLRTRERNCTDPTPSPLGKQCLGDAKESEVCSGHETPSFTATSLHAGITSGTVTFTTILLNQGNDYNSTSGIFTCEYPGIYHFTVSLTKKRASGIDNIQCFIRLNNSGKIKIAVNPHDDSSSDFGSYSASASATFLLQQDDKVNIGGCSNATYFDSSPSMFSGFLVSQHIAV